LDHPIEPTAENLWEDVAGRLRGALNEKTFSNWFSEVTPVSVDDAADSMQVTWQVTIEREHGDKPCCVAEWIVRYYPADVVPT